MFNVFDEDEGKPFRLWSSEEYKADLDKHAAGACAHEQLELCEFTDAGGNRHFKRYCLRCGEIKGTSIARREIGDRHVSAYDKSIAEKYSEARSLEFKAIQQKHIRIQKRDSGEVSKEYRTHLASDKWRKEIRPKVMKRANGICEGCLDKSATEVHHLTYEHLGNEFMFELLAVCNDCHGRLHPTDETIAAEVEAEIARLDCQCRFGDDPGLEPQCGKFCISVKEAIAPDGPCGPHRDEHEGYK